jgi:hypothetical protein
VFLAQRKLPGNRKARTNSIKETSLEAMGAMVGAIAILVALVYIDGFILYIIFSFWKVFLGLFLLWIATIIYWHIKQTIIRRINYRPCPKCGKEMYYRKWADPETTDGESWSCCSTDHIEYSRVPEGWDKFWNK